MRYQEDELYEAENENGNTISIDMRPADIKGSLSPTEMLVASLCGCSAVDIVTILKKRKKTVKDLKIFADGTRRESHPRGFTDIHLRIVLTSPDASVEELEKASQLSIEKYCSVASSLKSNITYSVEANS